MSLLVPVKNALLRLKRKVLRGNKRICPAIPRDEAIKRGILLMGMTLHQFKCVITNDERSDSTREWITKLFQNKDFVTRLHELSGFTPYEIQKMQLSIDKAPAADVLQGILNTYDEQPFNSDQQNLQIRVTPEIAAIWQREDCEKKGILFERVVGSQVYAFIYGDGRAVQEFRRLTEGSNSSDLREKIAVAAGLGADPAVVKNLAFLPQRVKKDDFDKAVTQAFGRKLRQADTSQDDLNRQVRAIRVETEATGFKKESAQPKETPQNRIQRLFNNMVQIAYWLMASDLKLSFDYSINKVKFEVKIDGAWYIQALLNMDDSEYNRMLNHVKKLAKVSKELADHEVRDAKIKHAFTAKDGTRHKLNGRLNLYPIDQTMRPPEIRDQVLMTIRLHRTEGEIRNLSELGLLQSQIELLDFILESEKGLIIISGSTDAGKSVTQAALLKKLYVDSGGKKRAHILDDPQEFDIPFAYQTEVNRAKGMTPADYLAGMMRLSCNILIIGEVNDAEKADAAVRTALSSHLGICTVHTGNPFLAWERLEEFGVPRARLASVIKSVVHQTLLPVLCPECSEPEDMKEILNPKKYPHMEELLAHWGMDVKNFRPRRATGLVNGQPCPNCSINGEPNGHRGRIGIFEVADFAEVATLIRQGADMETIREELLKMGHITSLRAAMTYVQAGIIDMPSARRVVDRIDPIYEGLKKFEYSNYDWRKQGFNEQADEIRDRFKNAKPAGFGTAQRPSAWPAEPPIIDVPATGVDESEKADDGEFTN